MSIYEILKRIIARGGYDAAGIQNKMDVFMLFDRLTVEQYNELAAQIKP